MTKVGSQLKLISDKNFNALRKVYKILCVFVWGSRGIIFLGRIFGQKQILRKNSCCFVGKKCWFCSTCFWNQLKILAQITVKFWCRLKIKIVHDCHILPITIEGKRKFTENASWKSNIIMIIAFIVS